MTKTKIDLPNSHIILSGYKLEDSGEAGYSTVVLKANLGDITRKVTYHVTNASGEIQWITPNPMPSMFREVHSQLRTMGHMRKVEFPSWIVTIRTLGRIKTYPTRYFSIDFLKSIPHVDDL